VPGTFDSLTALRTLDISGNTLPAISATVLSAKLNQLNFLGATQSATMTSTTVNVSLLQGLQGVFWVEERFCAPGFYSVGQKVCLRCPAGTYQNKAAVQAGDTDWLSCGACPGLWAVRICVLKRIYLNFVFWFSAGTVDDDFHAQSPCARCPAGSYSPPGASGHCVVCATGTTDDDADASTPCVAAASTVNSASSTVAFIVGGTLGGIVLLVIVVVVLLIRRERLLRAEKNRPLSFDEQSLREQGLILENGESKIHEISRRRVKVLETLGEGQYGVVCKGLVSEMAGSVVPEYPVAIKVGLGYIASHFWAHHFVVGRC
jgi:hypothetical protein